MFGKYAELVKNIFEGISKGKSSATFWDYISVLGYTLGIMGTILVAVLLVYVFVKEPKLIYTKQMDKYKKIQKEISDSLLKDRTEAKVERYNNCEKKMSNFKRLFWTGIVFFYVPLLIPTVLILVDLCIRVIG